MRYFPLVALYCTESSDTGADTMTGGRLKRVAKYLDDETFCLTNGDGLSDVNIGAEVDFHKRHGKLATVLAVQPPGRFGVLNIGADQKVRSVRVCKKCQKVIEDRARS